MQIFYHLHSIPSFTEKPISWPNFPEQLPHAIGSIIEAEESSQFFKTSNHFDFQTLRLQVNTIF